MRLIDADEVKAKIESTLDMQDLYLPYHFYNILDETPIVDAVEVVRCKDCVNCSECITDDGMYIYIRCLRNGATIYEDDFCSWGERREDETDRC